MNGGGRSVEQVGAAQPGPSDGDRDRPAGTDRVHPTGGDRDRPAGGERACPRPPDRGQVGSVPSGGDPAAPQGGEDLSLLATERRDERFADLDTRSTLGVLEAMNVAERQVPVAVATALPALSALVDETAERLEAGGRLIYVGAGTSGRLGVLDAAECPPTFHTEPRTVQALMAGGRGAMFEAVEGAEDDAELGAADVRALEPTGQDVVVGIAASGRTPYVLGALSAAREAGALTGSVTCSPGSPVAAAADHPIEVVVGPEVLTGSTRLKAGSATKQVLNMLSTAVMVRTGKVYGNLMVDVSVTNAKLRDRAERLVRTITGVDAEQAAAALAASGDRVKVAAVMLRRGLDRAAAEELLERSGQRLGRALEEPTGAAPAEVEPAEVAPVEEGPTAEDPTGVAPPQ